MSQIKQSRAKKPRMHRRVNHAELNFPLTGPKPTARTAHLLAYMAAIAGILVRRRSLGAPVLVRKIVYPGKIPVFYGKTGIPIALDIAPEGGLG